MKRKLLSIFALVFTLAPTLCASGEEKFSWLPITAADWAVAEDTSKGIRNAVVLFEKIIADDSKYMADDKCYLTIYRRIKIFNAEGRKWGDVTAPFAHGKEKVDFIFGRTILPDGKEIPLLPEQIFEKEVLKAKGLKLVQKTFSLPGIVEGCVVEYVIKYRLSRTRGVWQMQKEIVVQNAEMRWIINRDSGVRVWSSYFYFQYMSPNFIWLPADLKVTVNHLPSLKEAKEIQFQVANVPAFESEPHSLPEVALQWQLRYYYGSPGSAEAYWGELARNLTEGFDLFTRANKRVKNLVADWQTLESEDKKIAAAYAWLQVNIKNVAYLDEEDKSYKENKTSDEVIKNGYGSQLDINLLFYDMLREMNIDAKMTHVVDRDDNLLVLDAKYWQFDRSLVAVPTADRSNFRFYSPGDLHLTLAHVPWFNEGVSALMTGSVTKQFVGIPFSSSNQNRVSRVFTLQLQEEAKLTGKLEEQRLGHAARDLRLLFAQSSSKERQQKLQDELKELFPELQSDSVTVNPDPQDGTSVSLSCKLSFPGAEQGPGSRVLLQPFEFLQQNENPFQSEKRKSGVVFDYAQDVLEVININLPDNWAVEAVPADTAFHNAAGLCEIRFQILGQTLNVQRLFRLSRPYWPATEYVPVRRLFLARQSFNTLAVVLKRQGS